MGALTFFNLLIIVYSSVNGLKVMRSGDWNYYKHGIDWEGKCAEGDNQSPIALPDINTLEQIRCGGIYFSNYYTPFVEYPRLTNLMESVVMNIPVTEMNVKPYITAKFLNGKYMASNVHFHWGSEGERYGSEHSINGTRFEVEMHIGHIHERFRTVDEALHFKDGIVVLAVMINSDALGAHNGQTVSRKYMDLFNALSVIVNFKESTSLPLDLTLGRLLQGVDRNKFYTYLGSFSTPNCEESVRWIVFQHPIILPYEYITRFWKLKDPNGKKKKTNFRVIQPTNDRLIEKYVK